MCDRELGEMEQHRGSCMYRHRHGHVETVDKDRDSELEVKEN